MGKKKKGSHAGAQSPQMERLKTSLLGTKNKTGKPKRQIINFMLQLSEERRSPSCLHVG